MSLSFRRPWHSGDGDLRADALSELVLRLSLRSPHPLHPLHRLHLSHAGHRSRQVRHDLLYGPALHLEVRFPFPAGSRINSRVLSSFEFGETRAVRGKCSFCLSL